MHIRAAQIAALSRTRRAAFLLRLRQFIEENTHRFPEEDTLAALYERALGYGLITEQEFAGYIVLAWGAGVKPPAADPRWIAEIMNDPYRVPEGKVKAIFDRASLRFKGRA